MCKDSKHIHFVQSTSTLHSPIHFKESTEKYEDRHSCTHKASAIANPFPMLVANGDDGTPRPDKMGVPLLSDPEVYKV